MTTAHRYALYFCPPEPWADIGRRWLGRCEQSGQVLLRHPGTDAGVDRWTLAPRHYGLHATLKAPWRLRAGASPEQLDAAVRALAARQRDFDISVTLQQLRGFLAWCIDPAEDALRSGSQAIGALANDVVSTLDDLRAPPTDIELARRRPDSLSASERAMLAQWGYPYAYDTFKFHMTLTGQLSAADLDLAERSFQDICRHHHLPLSGRMPVRSISIYVQPVPDADFVTARHYGFDGTLIDGVGSAYLQA